MAFQEITNFSPNYENLAPSCENCLYQEKCRGEWYEDLCGYCEYWDPK